MFYHISFFQNLVNDTFLNLQSVFTRFISSTKQVKQVVLINHSWVSPYFSKGLGLSILQQKKGVCDNFIYPKKKRLL